MTLRNVRTGQLAYIRFDYAQPTPETTYAPNIIWHSDRETHYGRIMPLCIDHTRSRTYMVGVPGLARPVVVAYKKSRTYARPS